MLFYEWRIQSKLPRFFLQGGVKLTIYQLSQVGSIGVWNLEMDFSVGKDVVLSRLLSDETRSQLNN
jgi:hypothetical protein